MYLNQTSLSIGIHFVLLEARYLADLYCSLILKKNSNPCLQFWTDIGSFVLFFACLQIKCFPDMTSSSILLYWLESLNLSHYHQANYSHSQFPKRNWITCLWNTFLLCQAFLDHGYDTLEICKQVNGLGVQDDDKLSLTMVKMMMAVRGSAGPQPDWLQRRVFGMTVSHWPETLWNYRCIRAK